MRKSDLAFLVLINLAMAVVVGLMVQRSSNRLAILVLLILLVFNAVFVRRSAQKSRTRQGGGQSYDPRWPRALGVFFLVLAPFHVLVGVVPLWLGCLFVAFQALLGGTFIKLAAETQKLQNEQDQP